jgi:hypothetical protein
MMISDTAFCYKMEHSDNKIVTEVVYTTVELNGIVEHLVTDIESIKYDFPVWKFETGNILTDYEFEINLN